MSKRQVWYRAEDGWFYGQVGSGRRGRKQQRILQAPDTPANRAAMPDADFSSWTPPAKIAGVVLWLASEAASTVRGALLPV